MPKMKQRLHTDGPEEDSHYQEESLYQEPLPLDGVSLEDVQPPVSLHRSKSKGLGHSKQKKHSGGANGHGNATKESKVREHSRPTNNQLEYKAIICWEHYPELGPTTGPPLPQETPSYPAVNKAFLQVLNILKQAEERRGSNRNILQILAQNTRRTKVVDLEATSHRIPEELRKQHLSDGHGGQYTTNLDRNRYGTDRNYLFTVTRYNLEQLQLCPCLVEIVIVDQKTPEESKRIQADPSCCTCHKSVQHIPGEFSLPMSTFPSIDPLGSQMQLDPLYKSMLIMNPPNPSIGIEPLPAFGAQSGVSAEEQEQLQAYAVAALQKVMNQGQDRGASPGQEDRGGVGADTGGEGVVGEVVEEEGTANGVGWAWPKRGDPVGGLGGLPGKGAAGEAGAPGNGMLNPVEKEDSLQNMLDNINTDHFGGKKSRHRGQIRRDPTGLQSLQSSDYIHSGLQSQQDVRDERAPHAHEEASGGQQLPPEWPNPTLKAPSNHPQHPGATPNPDGSGENHLRRGRQVERQQSRANLIPAYVRELQQRVRQLEQDNSALRRKVERLEHTAAEFSAPTWADVHRLGKLLQHLQTATQVSPNGQLNALLQTTFGNHPPGASEPPYTDAAKTAAETPVLDIRPLTVANTSEAEPTRREVDSTVADARGQSAETLSPNGLDDAAGHNPVDDALMRSLQFGQKRRREREGEGGRLERGQSCGPERQPKRRGQVARHASATSKQELYQRLYSLANLCERESDSLDRQASLAQQQQLQQAQAQQTQQQQPQLAAVKVD